MGLVGGNERLHFLLLLNLALAASLLRPSTLSPEGFPASFLEAFSSSVEAGSTDFAFLGFALLFVTFLQNFDRRTVDLLLTLGIQGSWVFWMCWRMGYP